MIRESERSQLALVDAYIAERKARANDFLNNQWFPDFMKDFTTHSGIEQKLAAANDAAAKVKLLEQFSSEAAAELQKRRSAIFDGIDALSRLLKQRLQEHYENMLMANETLTAHLEAAAKLTETREQLLKELGAPSENILPMDAINKAMDKLTEFQGKIKDAQKIVDETKTLINQGGTNGK
jgi:23S rRNA A1618 N6-methylase RlmF